MWRPVYLGDNNPEAAGHHCLRSELLETLPEALNLGLERGGFFLHIPCSSAASRGRIGFSRLPTRLPTRLSRGPEPVSPPATAAKATLATASKSAPRETPFRSRIHNHRILHRSTVRYPSVRFDLLLA